VSLLPQRVALYPYLTVGQNLNLASRERQRPEVPPRPPVLPAVDPSAIRQAVAGGPPVADAPGSPALDHLLARYPHQLSGGQRQLVGLAKLFAQGRPVWLLDEPFSGLDVAVREDFRHDLHLLGANTGATIVLVTHDPADALALGRRIGVLGDGVLRQLGTADELRSRPGDRFAAVCLAGMSLLDGRVVGDGASARFVAAGGAVAGPMPRGLPDNLALGIRPEDLQAVPPGRPVNPDGGHVALTGWPVVSAEPVGSGWRLALALGDTRLRAGPVAGSPPPVGTPTDWLLPPDRCHWFRRDTGGRAG
jgi:ABC-type sugar transport system ATPase subunit